MEENMNPEATVAPNGTRPSDALVATIRKVLAQMEHSEQSLHVRLRANFHDFLAAYEANIDHTEPLARIKLSLQVATAELALKKGNLSEAKAIATAGFKADPTVPEFVLCLGRVAASEQKYDDALIYFKEALAKGMSDSIIYNNIALMYQAMGNFEEAAKVWATGFPNGNVTHSPYTGTGEPVRALVVTSPLIGNVRYRLFMHTDDLDITMICADSCVSDTIELPEHDILFSSIGDADLCAHSLQQAKRVVAKSKAPILNHPAIVELTSREFISKRLADVPGVKTALIERFTKKELMSSNGPALLAEHGFTYPFLLRSPGFQNGSHFEMVESPELLAQTAEGLPTDDILALSYLNTRAEDGTVRKIRVMRINGKLYPIHLAVSLGWKVHYHSSAMEDFEQYRAEEQRFLEGMHGFLGAKVIQTLEHIFDTLNLDYAGIDFSVDEQGDVAVYEANATMAILTPNDDPKWDYRRAPLKVALKAAGRMFYERAPARQTLQKAA